jgi:hypothetical protein
VADTAAPWPVLRGRYQVGEELSRSGVVVTRRGCDELLQRDVAVTMRCGPVPADAGRDGVELAREVLTGLDHPALPRVFDGGTERDQPYLIMELFGGESLRRRRGRGPLERRAAAEVGAALADLLVYLHARGLVHGPMPPEAVWIEEDGRVRVGGLGITRAPDDPQNRRAATAEDVASLGRLLRAATAQDAPDAGRWGAQLNRMTAAAPGDRPAPAEVRARLQALAVAPAAGGAAQVRTEEPATPRELVPAVPVTAALRSPAEGRARVVLLRAAAAALFGAAALLAAPTLSTLGGEGGGGRATIGIPPTPVRPSPTSPAEPTVVPAAVDPPPAGDAGRKEAPKGKAKDKAEKKKDEKKDEERKDEEKDEHTGKGAGKD